MMNNDGTQEPEQVVFDWAVEKLRGPMERLGDALKGPNKS